jgi:hypothetical protein
MTGRRSTAERLNTYLKSLLDKSDLKRHNAVVFG